MRASLPPLPSRLVIVEESDQNPLKHHTLPPENNHKLKTKLQDIYVASINVRTLISDSRLEELHLALKPLKWDIVGLCEIRRKNEIIEEHSDFIFYHTAATHGRNGVGFLVKRYLRKDVVSFKSISDRVAVLEIQISDNLVWTIIQVYAPTEAYKTEDIDKFYYTIEQAMDYATSKNIILLGDFNAKIGKRQKFEDQIMGKFSYGHRSPHGQKLTDFALENNFKIVNTMYKRKPHKKWTWRSPNGKLYNEIDFILINKSLNVKSFDIINNLNFNSDHRMVRCKLSINNIKRRRTIKPTNYTRNVPALTEEETRIWESKMTDALQKAEDVQGQYQHFVSEIKAFLKLLPGEVKKEKCISKETMQLLEQRKVLYKETRTKTVKSNITKISKEINRNISNQKKKFRQSIFEKFITQSGALRKAYKELRDKSEWATTIKNKRGRELTRRPDIIQEATRFYKELYSSNSIPLNVTKQSIGSVDQKIAEPQGFLKSEIEYAITTQKNDKTPGNDNITNEVLKSLCFAISKPLQLLFDSILNTESTPEQWSKSIITLLHKKGDRDNIGNYRPISLMTNIYKIFSKVILNRIYKTLDESQPREQAGFRKSYSTIDHLQVTTQIIEKANEYGITIYMCFIDYQKAFDSLHHDAIWEALTQQGIHQKYVNLINEIYRKCSAKVRLEREGLEFRVEKGVRQGDPLSPKLFSAVLETVFRRLDWENKGIKINGEYLSHLRFADDIVVFAENASDLQDMVSDLTRHRKMLVSR